MIKNVSLLAASLLPLLLVPQAVRAATADCPVEPKSGQAIASGEVYAGTNCTLHTPGDVDSFVFTADAGQTWQIVVGYQGGQSDVCFILYDPANKQVFPSSGTTCTNKSFGVGDAIGAPTLTSTGQYTIAITEPPGGGAAVSPYAVSLERITPFPPDGVALKIGTPVSAGIATPTAQAAYIFYGATTGLYKASVTYVSGAADACIYLFDPGSATPAASPDQGCSNKSFGVSSYSFQFTPTKSENYMLLVDGGGNDATLDYEVEVSCVAGTCPTIVPSTTTLSSSLNPSGDGEAVTFTAVVSSPDGAPPNGEIISFMNGATKLGTGTLSGGKATFSDSKLTPGATTAVTAVYPGDANLKGSTSNAVEQVVYGPCTLSDSASYTAASKTLTMKFTVGSIVATTWTAWLIDDNTVRELFSGAGPVTQLPETVTKTSSVTPAYRVGILSTLSTPTNGIYCSSYTQINTGTP